jgi:transposase
MARGGVISERVWERLDPLLPSSVGRSGKPLRDRRQVLEGIVFRYRTGCAWRDLPPEFGPWQTVWKRHHRYSADGTWDVVLAELLAELLAEADAAGELDWVVSIDSSVIRAHQHAATARRSPAPAGTHTGGGTE